LVQELEQVLLQTMVVQVLQEQVQLLELLLDKEAQV